MKDVRQCVLCHEPHGKTGFKANLYGRVHFPLQNGGCHVCNEGKNDTLTLRYQRSENCIRCHGETVGTSVAAEEDKIHKPVAQSDCIACHNPHLVERPKMLLEEPNKLCDWCHGMLMRNQQNKHGVFKDGNCRTCHRPHISDTRPLLKDPQPQLCLKCHPTALPDKFERDAMLHGALKGGKCSGCHNPHASDEAKLVRASRDAACADCHKKSLVDEKGKPWTFLHGPVGANQCTACHELRHRHVSKPSDKFLRTDPPYRACEACHQLPPEHVPYAYRSRMPRIGNDCLGCHLPHGAGNKFMLKVVNP
jgi:predicted CXXCH cytochrome family protein